MSWMEICRIHSQRSLQQVSRRRFPFGEQYRAEARLASSRIFGGAPLAGMTEDGASMELAPRNRKLLTKKEKEMMLNRYQFPFVRPEVMSGRVYREREKLTAKIQAGLKGPYAGAGAEGKKKKKK